MLGALPAGEKPSDLSVLLVTLDTTRADHMGAYGYQGIETPTFDRLAREGVLFEHAESAAPLTLPAHSSIFTGLFPPEHGVRDNGGFFLAPSQVTLAERLKAAGLETGGFVGAYVLDHRWGINQGFDTYFDDFDLSKVKAMSLASIQRPANEVADHVIDWLNHTGDHRFFGWAHFYDAHTPYDPPEPFKSRYPGHPYVGEIAFVDSQVGRLIDWLEAHHRLDRTIVVVMGDHGESLGDHGEAAHGFFIYQSTIRVPFVIRAPFALTRGRRVADVVRSVDVMPTILDLLGLPLHGKVEGKSLVPLMTGATREMGLEAYSEAVYPRYHFGWSDLRALHVGRYKYIEAPRPGAGRISRIRTRTSSTTSTRSAGSWGTGWPPRSPRSRGTCRPPRPTRSRRPRWTPTRASGWPRSATSGASCPWRCTTGRGWPTRRTRSACST